MKTIRLMSAAAGALLLLSSCSDKDPYSAGFTFVQPSSRIAMVYANNTSTQLTFFSYGRWAATQREGNTSWATLGASSGIGYAYSTVPVSMAQNTTGEPRYAIFHFADTDHPGDASADVYVYQYATRGDGSLGSAADPVRITGTDGSVIDIAYDDRHRPTSVDIRKDDVSLRRLAMHYSDADSMLTVTDGSTVYSGYYGDDYQPGRILSSADTVGYFAVYTSSYVMVDPSYAFDYQQRHAVGDEVVVRHFPDRHSLAPDSLHNTDSLHVWRNKNMHDKVFFTYSDTDNRRQSIDANQLVFGAEACDPYLLLSMFSYTRSARVLSEARSQTDGAYVVTHTLNADKSLHTLSVTHDGTTVDYTFEY